MSVPEVIIDQGKLRGSVATDIRGENYYSFRGIPYAKPPVGELRFKAPVPPEKWNGVFDATKEGNPSYARDMYKKDIIIGSEDCLVLNVYTKQLPDKKETDLRPVLFWIHGGGLIVGHSGIDQYGPDFLLTEEVVVVTINYRLGILGFLSFEDPKIGIPGNAGFKDMIMALKWVQKNISHFGGDPNNVTIFGESAGGLSVHVLLLSPMSRGLFHKAIAQSGCALNPWGEAKKGIKDIARIIGQENADEKTIYKQLMSKTVEEIFEIQEKLADNIVASEARYFGIVIEPHSHEQAFLTEEPTKIISSGTFNQVPFMAGYTTSEGICFELFKSPNAPSTINFEDIIPWTFGYQRGTSESKAVAEKIKQFYYGSEEQSPSNRSKKFVMLGDTMFVYGIYTTIFNQFAVSKAPTYMYRVSVESELNYFKKFVKVTEPGTSHCDDLGYLFTNFATPVIKPGSFEETAYRRFVRLWTNFAKYGNPTPASDPLLNVVWKPVTNDKIDFLDIGENLVPSQNPDLERIKFWQNLFANSPNGQKTHCSFPECS